VGVFVLQQYVSETEIWADLYTRKKRNSTLSQVKPFRVVQEHSRLTQAHINKILVSVHARPLHVT